MEGVVSLFKERGGGIIQIQSHTPSECDVFVQSQSLYARSRGNDLMWIPDIDKAKQEIIKSQDRLKVAQICQDILGKDGTLTLGVSTYERVSGESKPTVL